MNFASLKRCLSVGITLYDVNCYDPSEKVLRIYFKAELEF